MHSGNVEKNNTSRFTHLAEPGPLLPEQGSFGNAAGVHAAERDAGAVVVSSVQLGNGHHVTNLGVFVGLSAEEGLAIRHSNGLLRALLKALQFSEIGPGVDETAA